MRLGGKERKKTMAQTTYSSKCLILADLWLNFRNDEEFTDFVEYNDLGLPLAYAIANNIVPSTEIAEKFVGETFDLLLAGLEIEDTGFELLDDLLDSSEPN
jgi:hypothetical protein